MGFGAVWDSEWCEDWRGVGFGVVGFGAGFGAVLGLEQCGIHRRNFCSNSNLVFARRAAWPWRTKVGEKRAEWATGGTARALRVRSGCGDAAGGRSDAEGCRRLREDEQHWGLGQPHRIFAFAVS